MSTVLSKSETHVSVYRGLSVDDGTVPPALYGSISVLTYAAASDELSEKHGSRDPEQIHGKL